MSLTSLMTYPWNPNSSLRSPFNAFEFWQAYEPFRRLYEHIIEATPARTEFAKGHMYSSCMVLFIRVTMSVHSLERSRAFVLHISEERQTGWHLGRGWADLSSMFEDTASIVVPLSETDGFLCVSCSLPIQSASESVFPMFVHGGYLCWLSGDERTYAWQQLARHSFGSRI